MYHQHKIESLYDLVTGEEDARVCKDIPDEACDDQPRNFFAYLAGNTLSKVADEIASAKLILPWLLGALGAPPVFTGFLVPIREAGVLLPQLVVAAYIRRLAVRKWVWVLGAALSALALAGMTAVALTTRGVTAGWTLIAALVVFALARGLCSVSAKDVVGKTVSKTRRGRLMGLASGISGLGAVGIGAFLALYGGVGAAPGLLALLLGLAALLWLPAIAAFVLIREPAGATEGGGNALETALESLAVLARDAHFRRFVIGRTLLLGVALAPPFYVLLAQQQGGGVGDLGLLVIGAGIASALSTPVWGWFGDHSSRLVMTTAATLAGALGILLWLLAFYDAPLMRSGWTHAVAYVVLIVAHSGVRLGRKVYLVDMATQQNRATFVALSNTIIGVAMLAAGFVGALAGPLGAAGVIALLSVVSLIAAVYAWRLPDVSA